MRNFLSTVKIWDTLATESFSSGTPGTLSQVGGRAVISSTDVFTYDVAKDGQRFLVNRYAQFDRIEPLILVLNASSFEQK